jgi:hypothetical protein
MEEQIPLFFVFEAMLSAQAKFLGDPSDAEGLTRESGAKDIMRGDLIVSKKGRRPF